MDKINFIKVRFSNINDVAHKLNPVIEKSNFWIKWDFLKCHFRYGCNKEDYIGLEFYKKSHLERNKFITATRNYVWLYRNHYTPKDRLLLESKCAFNLEFTNFIKRKWISTKDSSASEIQQFIYLLGEVIVKPDLGLQGKGVYILKDNETAKINNLLQQIKSGKHFIIEEIIKQHPDMAYFNDSCVNTCRIETVTDKFGEAHIINTIVITGGKDSRVSNTHTGGVMMHIDPDSGIIDTKGRNPEGKFYLHHPATNVLLVGRKIPYWEDIKDLAIRLAEHIPSARYVGWDIAITKEGPDVVEGNIQVGHCTQACDMVGRWPIIKSYL